MKKTLFLLTLVLTLGLAFGACTAPAADVVPTDDQGAGDVTDGEGEVVPPEDAIELAPQTLTGTATGFGGDVTATIDIDNTGAITGVTVETPGETEGIGVTAAPVVAQAIVDAQSVNVDTVSGATMTSNAVIEAVTNALTEAGLLEVYSK